MIGLKAALEADAKARLVWTPPPRLTASQWADASRMLSSEGAPEPGRWDTSRAEYQREIMDACTDPAVETVVIKTSSQVGKTEILNNAVAFHIAHDPCPILVLLPTIELGEAWSKDRLAPMLRDTPSLRDRVAPARSRDGGNTLRHKQFMGGHLTIAGANSPASLASRPIRLLIADEVDRFGASAGAEGDAVDLARKRTTAFWNRKIIMASSPLHMGRSRIGAAYLASDQRRYWIPCPHCAHFQTLRWDQVRWTDDDPATSAYHCAECGAAWTDAQRWGAVRLGHWRAEAPFRGTAGFALSELYSPWRRIEQTVDDFLAAKGSAERLKVWKNTALGEEWQEAGEAPDWERLNERRELFQMGVVPTGTLVLTAGVDNQAAPERLEMAVWAWGAGYEAWLIDVFSIEGNPAAAAPWDEVHAILNRDWPVEGGGTMRIARVGVDTGGQHTAGVYAQLRRLRDPRIAPVKGAAGWSKSTPVSGPTYVDVTAGGHKIKRGLKLWTVSVDVFKAEFYRRLWLTKNEDGTYPVGWVHLPDGITVEHVKQLVAEQLVTIKDRRGFSRHAWDKLRANEQLDMLVYARAALSLLGSDRYGERFWTNLAKQIEPGEPEAMQPPERAEDRQGGTRDPITLPPVSVPVTPAPSVRVIVAGEKSSRSARMAR